MDRLFDLTWKEPRVYHGTYKIIARATIHPHFSLCRSPLPTVHETAIIVEGRVERRRAHISEARETRDELAASSRKCAILLAVSLVERKVNWRNRTCWIHYSSGKRNTWKRNL